MRRLSPDESEWKTRKCMIDPRLRAAGWRIARFDASRRLGRNVPLAVGERMKLASTRAEKLTQAILAEAFWGALVPTEAELARARGRSYESVSALRARIFSSQTAESLVMKDTGPAVQQGGRDDPRNLRALSRNQHN